jgi:tetratricopeptide (TPR) repeat protein
MPVRALPPGQYVARAVVTSGDEIVGKLTRPFEIAKATALRGTTAGAPLGGVTIGKLERADAMKADVLGFFLDSIASSRVAAAPGLKAVIASARSGKLQGAGMAALEAGDQAAAAFMKGMEFFAEGKLDPAAVQFKNAATIDPALTSAVFYLGACFAAAGRDKEAATYWSKPLPSGDAPIALYEMLADLWLRVNDSARAVAALKDGVARWPAHDPLRRRLGIAYAALGDHPNAIATLDPYISRNAKDHEVLMIALQALYDARVAGKPVGTAQEDRERANRYARTYAAAGGPMQTLVMRWADFVGESGAASR